MERTKKTKNSRKISQVMESMGSIRVVYNGNNTSWYIKPSGTGRQSHLATYKITAVTE